MIFIFPLIILLKADCIPYGERLSLGKYFTEENDTNNYITLTFNAKSECQDFVVTTYDVIGLLFNIPVTNIQLLNMTDIYKDSEEPIIYETYIYTISIGAKDGAKLNTMYAYFISWEGTLITGPYYFRIPSKQLTYKSKFIVTGDMDSNWALNTSKETFDWFQLQIDNKNYYDGILYMGDMAYDLEDDNCQVGDNFLRNISLFTSHFPFMLTAGNHDKGQNEQFTYIGKSFSKPTLNKYDNPNGYNDFYSFQVGNAYYVQFNPFKIAYGNTDKLFYNYTLEWMENELSRIRKNENVSWLIVYNHYPLYCSNPDDNFCQNHYETMKEFEDLFIKYKVDLFLAGHQHTYERDDPLYQNKIVDSKQNTNNSYTNPEGPIYIVEGAAGNDEIMPTEIFPYKFYTKFQAAGDGIGILEVYNETHLYFEHRMSKNDSVVDQLWIIKDNSIPDDDKNGGNKIWLWIGIIIGCLLIIGVIVYCIYKKKKVSVEDSFLIRQNS